ncbi:cytochrome P450 [Auricularia subglabra TFB-10046 SS5]|nr:cytochrome P450 [Auricularia subglabra TFB-10046 SS5]
MLSVDQLPVLVCTALIAVGFGVLFQLLDGPLAAQIASLRSITSCQHWILEGYQKYKARAFAVRIFRQYHIVISGPELIEELHRAPDEVFSVKETMADLLQADYTLKQWRDNHEFGVGLIRSRLTRSLPHLFPAAMDEMELAFADEITNQLNGNEWTAITPGKSLARVICRMSNRLFVGLPLCRDKDYVDLAVKYAMDVALSAMILLQIPVFLKPLVSRFLTPIPGTYARAERIMINAINERIRLHVEHSEDWQEKPDDCLEWVLEGGDARDKEPIQLMTRILRLNFAAIHTTSTSFTFALYHLCAHPETYQEPIRQEAHDVLSRWGWTTNGVQRLRKLDSFLREVMRFYGLRAITMDRKAMQDFTFFDGTAVKKGQTVSVASRPTHFDDSIYPDAATFHGFRFCDDGSEDSDLHLPQRLVSTSTDFLSFGTGRHACPGRFWAANEMKAMMAYMVAHYDMKMEREGVVPDPTWFGGALLPNMDARVLLRKHEVPAY